MCVRRYIVRRRDASAVPVASYSPFGYIEHRFTSCEWFGN